VHDGGPRAVASSRSTVTVAVAICDVDGLDAARTRHGFNASTPFESAILVLSKTLRTLCCGVLPSP
jgi:hypothetical protein